MWYKIKHRIIDTDKEVTGITVTEVNDEARALKLIEETMKDGTFINADCVGVSDSFYAHYAELHKKFRT